MLFVLGHCVVVVVVGGQMRRIADEWPGKGRIEKELRDDSR